MRIQTLLKVFILFLFFAVSARQAEASHLYGSEFTYEYMGPSGNATNPFRYKVILKYYVSCVGVNITTGMTFQYFNKAGAFIKNQSVASFPASPPIPLPIPPGCTVANLPCIQMRTFEATVDLPLSFDGYYVTASTSARNQDIDNLVNPDGQALFSYMDMPSPLTPSKSPVFTDTAVVVIFAGDTTSVINSAFDLDGDKLIYSFNQPFGNTSTATFIPSATVPTRINYVTGYSLAQPFGAGGYASINASTGLAKYYAPNAGNYVLSFQVKEYRYNPALNDYVFIGSTIRDIQLVVKNVTAAPNVKPVFTYNGPKQITITEGAAITPINFTFTDPDPGHLLTATISSPLLDGPGGINATFTTSTGTLTNFPSGTTGTFNFTSVCGNANNYMLNLSVRDNACPPKTHTEVFEIFVTPYQGPDKIFGDTVVCTTATKPYNVTAKASATYNWVLQGGGSIVGSPTNSAIQVNWTTPGRYKLTAYETSTGNCLDSVSFFVNVSPGINLTVNPPVTICPGTPVNLTVSGGTTYTWTDGTNTYTGANVTVNPTATTTYTVSSTATGGCVATGTVTVTVNPQPTISAPNQTICAGTTTSLTATGAGIGGTYSWTDGTNTYTGQSISISPTTTTTYSITGTTAGNCSNTGQVTITVTPQPVVAATASQTTICTGTSTTLSATGATTYTWTDGTNNYTGSNVNVNPTTTTTYTATGTTGGCSSTSQVTITVNPRPTVTGLNRVICAGQSTTLVGSGADAYTWVNGSTTLTGNNLTVSPTATTTYALTGTNSATGCTNNTTVTVTVNPLPTITPVPNQTICAGASATLSTTATPNTTYSWTGGPTTLTGSSVTVSPAATTTYTVTATNTLTNCQNTATVTVTVNPRPTITAASSQATICNGQSTTLTATGANTYTWTNGTNTFTGSSITVNPTTTTTYTVTGTNTATSCTNTATVTVTVNPTPNVTVTNRTICIGASTTLVAAGATTYSWTDGTNTYTGNNVTVSPTVTTVYTVTGTNTTNCTNTAQLTVTVNPLPVIPVLANQVICNGQSATLTVGSAATNTTYSWTGGPTTLTGATVTVSPTATTTYSVTATNTLTTCTNTRTVTVTVNPKPTANAGADQSVCSNAPASLGVAPVTGLTYSWSPATGLSSATIANPTATIANTGTTPIIRKYYLTVTNSDNCTAIDSVEITVKPMPLSNAGLDKTICSGNNTTLGTAATTGYTYSWSPTLGLSSATAANPTLTLTNTTAAPVTHTYTVTTTLNGCVTTDQVVVIVNPAITVDAGTDKTLCDLKSVTVGTPAISGYTYSWAANSGLSNLTSAMPVFTASNTTANPVTVKLYVTASAFGCSKTDSMQVIINPRPLADSIDGNPSVCPGVQGIPYTIRNPRVTAYQWIVAGGTIASGQGTDSITVNWGPAGPGSVKTFNLNSFGCSSDTIVLPVTINPLLITQKPIGPTQICHYQAKNVHYQIPFTTPGSVYTYQAFGGTITSANPSNAGVNVTWNAPGIGKLIVTQTSSTSLANCFGVSDTLMVTILPSPDTTLAITGIAKACEFTEKLTYSLAGSAGSTYAWTLNGTALTDTDNTIEIDLGAAGNYTLTVIETNAQGCPGRPIVKNITATPLPGTLTINGPSYVCPENMSRQIYYVSGMLGSTFTWTVTGSSSFTGNGTSIIHVEFDNTPVKSVSVVETTADGCVGNTFTLPVVFDNASLHLDAASTAENNDDEIVLNLLMDNNANNQKQLLVYRREAGTAAWNQVGAIANSSPTFTDNQVTTDQTIYEYKVESENECGTKLESNIHNTILLKVNADEKQGIVTLNWNSYKGWNNGIQEYQVYRKLDNETTFTRVNLTSGSLTDTTITLPATLVGFSQCYRIKAISTSGNLVSWSNGACADFANELQFYNIITPNNDGINDEFTIKNIELYADNELTIMNRWGDEVFKTKNYKNNWNGEKASAGTYFYMLKLSNGKTYKGWVEIAR